MPRIVGLLILCALVPVIGQADPILINGSFELGVPIPTQDIDILRGSTEITGWTATGMSIDYLGPPWDVSDGLRAVDLDGRDSLFSGIQQTFATLIGQGYLVSFDLSGNPHGSLVKEVRVAVDGVSHDYAHDSSGQRIEALLWQSLSFEFTASSPTATLSFTSLTPTPNSYGALIDNVNVTEVPEPSTLLLLFTGCATAALRMWRRHVLPIAVKAVYWG